MSNQGGCVPRVLPFFNEGTMEKEQDIFNITMFGQENEVKLGYASYNCNGTLALQLFCKAEDGEFSGYGMPGKMPDDPYVIPYGVATVNLPESEMLAPNEQFVDENNLPGIGRWMQKNGIATPTGQLAMSGYCTYQAYRFNVPEKELEKIVSLRETRTREQSEGRGRRM